ncbi:glycosyltransferase family 4 protein [bacterium]|nr:glycosyltransferase family 4 protein [bacterium]
MGTIAIDYTPAHEQGGGIGRLVRDLVAALAAHDSTSDYRLFVAGTTSHSLPSSPGSNFVWRPTRINPAWLARLWQRARVPLPIESFTGPIDLYHATDFVLPPTRPATRTLLTVHDLSFIRVPEAAPPQLRSYLNSVVPRSVHRADHVIADSAATKVDLVNLYHVPETRVSVLLSGVSPHFQRQVEGASQVRARYGIPTRPYIFSIGTVQPRKNYERIVLALKRLRESGLDVGLVIAGGRGWLNGPLYQTISDTGLNDVVHLIGFADDNDLPTLYSDAVCVAFPSLYEGFGFPVLEGMACGTPVVTSTVSSLPEVAGDAALVIDPYDIDALTEACAALSKTMPCVKRSSSEVMHRQHASPGRSQRSSYATFTPTSSPERSAIIGIVKEIRYLGDTS